MIPGELLPEGGDIELNAGRATTTLMVENRGDRPIQVGSHFHFFEVNEALIFERELARGLHLDIPSGTAVRFEPGDEKSVTLVPYVGLRQVYGFNNLVNGSLDGVIDPADLPNKAGKTGQEKSAKHASKHKTEKAKKPGKKK